MNTNAPSHESVTERARQVWRDRGCPNGADNEIWLEAERQLSMTASAQNSPSSSEGRGNGNSQGGLTPTDPKVAAPSHERAPVSVPSHPTPSEAAALASQQKKTARAPKQPAKVAPKVKPAETGKPLWDKPHSA